MCSGRLLEFQAGIRLNDTVLPRSRMIIRACDYSDLEYITPCGDASLVGEVVFVTLLAALISWDIVELRSIVVIE